MNILVVGSGGREHALCSAIAKHHISGKLWCAPGNPGIAGIAECISLKNVREIVNFCIHREIDFVVVGPETMLAEGLADALAVFSIPCFGPTKEMAKLESSKVYSAEICALNHIKMATGVVAFDAAFARAIIQDEFSYPLVIKADGLAAGKGVFICQNEEEAFDAIDRIMVKCEFGQETGKAVRVEEFLIGTEVSYFALCDGEKAIPFGTAQDHKRLLDGNQGPNTGGMGAISPAPIMTPELDREIMSTIIEPVVRHTGFKGVLFAGLMITADGPRVLEFNVRFGDPECQTMLPRLKENLTDLLLQVALGDLTSESVLMSDETSVSIIMASPGYPFDPKIGSEIKLPDDGLIFHSGTRIDGDKLLASGGRVLTVVGLGEDVKTASDVAYQTVSAVDWPEGIYRKDIGR